MARKRLTLAAALIAAAVTGEARVDAGDMLGALGLGHCSTCQRSYATVPAYVPVQVAQGLLRTADRGCEVDARTGT